MIYIARRIEKWGSAKAQLRLVGIIFTTSTHVEAVCILSKLNAKQHIKVKRNLDELDLTTVVSKATCQEIKDYVPEIAV